MHPLSLKGAQRICHGVSETQEPRSQKVWEMLESVKIKQNSLVWEFTEPSIYQCHNSWIFKNCVVSKTWSPQNTTLPPKKTQEYIITSLLNVDC